VTVNNFTLSWPGWLTTAILIAAGSLVANVGNASNSGSGQTSPTVCLINPANNAVFAAPDNLTLSALASETNGTITNVTFWLGSNLVASITNPPYTCTTVNLYAGAFALTAIATDASGISATSDVVKITVTNTPALAALQSIKTVFVIALENHDLVQTNPAGSPPQLLGSPAAPYFNSLITPGSPNAAQVSFATHYYSTAQSEHPSEQNYIWAEAGTDFGVHTDSDPDPTAGNVFTNVMHLSGQLTAAGISWRSYQEDLEYSSSPLISVSGTNAPANPVNGSTEYSYAVKHNPMAFFPDTQSINIYPLTNFWPDLGGNRVGRYNWITPDLYNDMHNSLSGGFVYQGVVYTGDLANIAEGDNFLANIIPQIMASPAYQDHGVIILWTDETESTDDTNSTLPCVIISPLAKGNAYASPLPYSHSSDLKTMDEIFALAWQTNAIPTADIDAQNTGYNDVDGSSAPVFDFSDFFAPGGMRITWATVLKSGGFQLSCIGPAGQTYQVLAANDPTLPASAWTVVGSGSFGTTNSVFTDPVAATRSSRYYQVKTP